MDEPPDAPTVGQATDSYAASGEPGRRETRNFHQKEQLTMRTRLFTNTAAQREKTDRSRRSKFFVSLGQELRDYYRYGNQIDWLTVIGPAAFGAVFGLALSCAVADGERLLIETHTARWAFYALGFALGGALTFLATISAGLAGVICVELLREARHPMRERRRSIRENTRRLRNAIVDDRIPLSELEAVRTSLRMRDDSAGRPGRDWYERILVNRWRRQRAHVEGLLEISWRESLPEAIAYLKTESARVRRTPVTPEELADSTEVAWHLASSPTNVAVQRLLCEYLPTERRDGNGRLEFRTGVVYTPRWVYLLVRPVENHHRAERQWLFAPAGRNTIGDECAPIGGVDRETVEKLYEPHGDGPLGSIREAVETARHV